MNDDKELTVGDRVYAVRSQFVMLSETDITQTSKGEITSFAGDMAHVKFKDSRTQWVPVCLLRRY